MANGAGALYAALPQLYWRSFCSCALRSALFVVANCCFCLGVSQNASFPALGPGGCREAWLAPACCRQRKRQPMCVSCPTKPSEHVYWCEPGSCFISLTHIYACVAGMSSRPPAMGGVSLPRNEALLTVSPPPFVELRACRNNIVLNDLRSEPCASCAAPSDLAKVWQGLAGDAVHDGVPPWADAFGAHPC